MPTTNRKLSRGAENGLKCNICNKALRGSQRLVCSKGCGHERFLAVHATPEVAPDRLGSALRRGEIAEILVVAELLSLGFEIFRPATYNASCDIIAIRDGKLTRIEVRASRPYCGGVTFGRYKRDTGRSDLYAVVTPWRDVLFIPHGAIKSHRVQPEQLEKFKQWPT